MRLLHLYLAAHLFLEAKFHQAGDYFLRGKIDPRLLVRLYPTFRGKIIGSAEEVEVFEGLRDVLSEMRTVDETSASCLARPHSLTECAVVELKIKRSDSLDITTKSQTNVEASESWIQLYEEAKSMLTDILRRTRASRRKGGGSRGIDSRKIDIVSRLESEGCLSLICF